MSLPAINPYQPPLQSDAPELTTGESAVRFYTTDTNLRFAESHFVLRLHPLRLVLVSLALIGVSSVAMVGAMFLLGIEVFLVVSAISLCGSAVIYLASVSRSKQQLRQRWREYGFRSGTLSSVSTEDDQLVLQSPAGTYRWPLSTIKTYWTRKGLMLSPEPMVCLFVPKKNESPPEAYRALKGRLSGVRHMSDQPACASSRLTNENRTLEHF